MRTDKVSRDKGSILSLFKTQRHVYVLIGLLTFLIVRFLKNTKLLKARYFNISIPTYISHFLRLLIAWRLETNQTHKSKFLSVLLFVGLILCIGLYIVFGILFRNSRYLFIAKKSGPFKVVLFSFYIAIVYF